jgi:beta-glucosidase
MILNNSTCIKNAWLFCCLALLSFCSPAKKMPGAGGAGSGALDRRVNALLAQMTLEEKIGQMTLFTTDWGATGPTIREGYADDIRKGTCGALFNSHGVKFTRALQRIAVEESRLKIPLLFGFDVIHGYKTIFPIPLGEAASFDLEAAEQSARIAAVESAASGLHWTFAPMVDIGRDPRWGRVMEGGGEDTYLGCRLAEARVRGFQGKGIGQTDAVLACVKHYAAYGAAAAGRDYNTVDMSERFFREYYLPPYEAAVRAGAKTAMTSFNDYDGVPATGNKYLVTDILRKAWGFDGFVVTDYTSINEMVNHGVVANDQEAGELAVSAGVDMDMQGDVFHRFLAQSVREGKVSVAQIDEAARRILRLKFELGLFENPYKFCDENREKTLVFSRAHRDAARNIARKSIVLLKNQNNVLPLNAGQRVALIGPLADNKNDLMGAWSGAGDGPSCVSMSEALAARGLKIEHARGCDIAGTDKNGFAAAVAAAQKADVVLAVLGENAAMSGEAASRAEIGLPGVQEDLLKALVATGKPVVVILMNGRPLTIPWAAENAAAILETWWLGTEAGNAIGDVLYGDYNPSGKLPMTFPRSTGQIPIHYNYRSTGRPYDPNSKWNSRYLDQPNAPLYPFGFGLSYTTFAYGEPAVDKAVFKQGETLRVTVRVSNTGKRAGAEVVQLYVRDLVGSVTRPVKELKGFQKIALQPGASQEVGFTLGERELGFFRKDMTFGTEPGKYEIMVGGSSEEVRKIMVELKN